MLVNIQVLRAIAAALIVVVHLQDLFPYDRSNENLFHFGYVGVDLFFVISGFIMVVTTARKHPSATAFFLDRIGRVAPLYYLVTLLVFVLALAAPSFFRTTSADPSSLLSSLLFIPFEKSPGHIYPVFFLGWTLNYEMFFYALFAGAIFLRADLRVPLCSFVIVALVVAGAIFEPTPHSGLAYYFYSQPIMLDFVLGMLIGQCLPMLSRNGLGIDSRLAASVLVGVALILFVVVPSTASEALPNTTTFFDFGVPSACIVLAVVILEAAGYRSKSSVLLTLGNASYSMYLTHYFVVGAFVAANSYIQRPLLMAVLAFLAVSATSVIIYRVVEKPLVARGKGMLTLMRLRIAE